MDPSPIFDVIIIGGGVVGLAVLRAATLQGWKCLLVEAEADLLSHASGSNSGIACTGVDASPGTLERALIRDANSNFRLYCQQHNLPTRPCGSLVCLWPWDLPEDESENSNTAQAKLQHVLDESHDAGDTHAQILSSATVQNKLEPNLAKKCQGAVHIPGEIVVDPWLYSISLAVHARENGAQILTNCRINPSKCQFNPTTGIWNIVSESNQEFQSKMVINAAGIMADLVQNQAHGDKHGEKSWTGKPRRGQYRIYSTNNSTMITHPIQPIPSQRTKGIFVFSTLYNQLVVGPTALDQSSRTDRSIDPQVAQELDVTIQRLIPNLNVKKSLVGEYVGIRPGTDRRDYQIHSFPQKHWISVAGIRSTGLTASLGIGNYVVRQMQSILDVPNRPSNTRTTPMPSIEELVRDFHNDNGYATIQGHRYKVTHPLTRFGLAAKTGIAAPMHSKL